MKRILLNIIVMSMSLLLMQGLASCQEEQPKQDPVDLRFDALDSYELAASQPDEISFVVKSSDPWEVYSLNPDWCEISPSSGGAGEKYTVTIRYTDNTELDDRTDTIVIKSDYWTGKEVTVNQKGTAYLNVDTEGFLAKEGSTGTMDITSNQKWSVAVVEGGTWLSLVSSANGEMDGSIRFSAPENKGERRTGTIVIYDRYGKEHIRKTIMQDGVNLVPETLEIKALYNVGTYILPVEANTEWTVTKDNPDAEWYRFNSDTFNGTADLEVIMEDNPNPELRKTSFTISSKPSEGSEPVKRIIYLKQAYSNSPVRYALNKLEVDSWGTNYESVGEEGVTFKENRVSRVMPAGSYSFHISSMGEDAYSTIFFAFPGEGGDHELRWHLNAVTGKTEISATPWISTGQTDFDPKVPNTLSLIVNPAVNPETNEEDGYTRVEWQLNGVTFHTLQTTGDLLTNIPWPAEPRIYIGSKTGTVTFQWYEHTPVIIWD